MAEKARLEEGLDMDNIANGLMGLQIWSQKLASVSEEDAHNIQMVSFSSFLSFECLANVSIQSKECCLL